MCDLEYSYFLEHPVFGKKEVTKEEWIQAERSAGFRPKHGGGGPATGGFSGNGISGSIRLKTLDKIVPVKVFPNRRTLRDELTDSGIL